MESKVRLSAKLMLTGGIIELLVAFLHFTWPFNMVQKGEFADLPEANKEFVILASLAIGLAVFIFGVLSIYFSSRLKYGEISALVFCLSQEVLWAFRLILELIYPVLLPVYFIENPTYLIIILIVLIMVIFMLPLFLIGKASIEESFIKKSTFLDIF